MREYEQTGKISVSALKADVDRQTARKYIAAGQAPAGLQAPHTWRTRADPLERIWLAVTQMLREAPELEAEMLFEHFLAQPESGLEGRHSRTFHRRVRQWRIYFGGYPGAAGLADDETQWKRYVSDSLIEPVLSRDVLQLQTVNKPALLRHLFALAATFPAQILSYTKMLGQLQDAGNTTTLAHYLNLLESAFLVSGLELFSKGKVRRRGSSPKLILWNNALINATSLRSFADARREGNWWGRLVENAVGAHLLNELRGPQWNITYWRDGDREVDFVVNHGTDVWALEVQSGPSGKQGGVEAFRQAYPKAKVWLIGAEGVKLEEFFSRPASSWFS